jgi:hypothetical protein
MATHTVTKGVDGMNACPVGHFVALSTLLGPGGICLGSCRRHADLMHVMTRRARDPLFGMRGLGPVDVLLMMAFRKLIGIEVVLVPSGVRG